MVRSRLREKVLEKVDAMVVWVCFRALHVNLAAQPIKGVLLVVGSGLMGVGCK
jgi:hypothetical protein